MVLRFANAIFEPIWNSRYIDHIEITAAETLGVEARAGYYETSGALRDMVQNHLIQLLTMVCMEPPTDLSADSVRDEKVKVLRSLRQFKSDADVKKNVVRGQYAAGRDQRRGGARVSRGAERQAAIADGNVRRDARGDRQLALGGRADLRARGQAPAEERRRRSACFFKQAPSVLFNQQPAGPDSVGSNNVLVIRIQPDEGVSLRMQSKLPGAALRVEPVKMDFQYGASFGKASPEAYERLLHDAMSGDPTLFARRDEVEEAWRFVDAIEQAWHGATDGAQTADGIGPDAPPLCEYPAGSWGPAEAEDLPAQDGRTWRRF